tara:strand:- start:128 stop:634 length:507 start_codon:yes stop_codon:yes gene_type:complete
VARGTRFKVLGVKQLAENMRQMTDVQSMPAARAAIDAMGRKLLERVKKNTSRRDYTLSQLQAMGHPYARRHGSIQVHPTEPNVVHSQSGRLSKSVAGRSGTKLGKPTYFVGFLNKPPPYVNYVLHGTKVMLPRDPIVMSASEPETRKKMYRSAIRAFNKQMRALKLMK